jgi:hypothetical protein
MKVGAGGLPRMPYLGNGLDMVTFCLSFTHSLLQWHKRWVAAGVLSGGNFRKHALPLVDNATGKGAMACPRGGNIHPVVELFSPSKVNP